MHRDIFGLLSVLHHPRGVRDLRESGNSSFRESILTWVKGVFNTNPANPTAIMPTLQSFPWKSPSSGYPAMGNNLNIRHGVHFDGNVDSGHYPRLPAVKLNTADYRRLRFYNSTSLLSSDISRVISAVVGADENNYNGLGVGDSGGWKASLLTLAEVPGTTIGNIFMHPLISSGVIALNANGTPVLAGLININSTAGQNNYVTLAVGSGNALNFPWWITGRLDYLRIESGADAGCYLVKGWDKTNGRVYLSNLDGSVFVANATASGISYSASSRVSFFNESNVIPNSLGSNGVYIDGRFNPGESRQSYIIRVIFEKGGFPSGDGSGRDASQIGSYWFSLTPWTHGDGINTNNVVPAAGEDTALVSRRLPFVTSMVNGFTGFVGGPTGYALDRTNQRMWFCTSDGTNGDICYWLYKTAEQWNEVASTSGSGPFNSGVLSPSVVMTNALPKAMDIGSDGAVYTALAEGVATTNVSLVVIRPNLSVVQLRVADGLPASTFQQLCVDRSRARTGTAADAATTGAGNITSPSGGFTASDVGRAVKLVGNSADNGVYLVSVLNSGTDVSVTNLDGTAVSFSGGSGGTFSIGDRIYLFFNDTITNSNTLRYSESLALDQTTKFFSSALTIGALPMTNGKNITNIVRYGELKKCVVDQNTGNLYWLSTDVTSQINKFAPATNSVALRTISGTNPVQPGAGFGGTLTAPTLFSSILFNEVFDELWVGTDQGHVRIMTPTASFTGSVFGTNFMRYFGNPDTGTYRVPSTTNGAIKSDGSSQHNSRYVRGYFMFPDGHVCAVHASGSVSASEITNFGREADNWTTGYFASTSDPLGSTTSFQAVPYSDPYGAVFNVSPALGSSLAGSLIVGYATNYQWDSSGARWFPKEMMRGPLPNKDISDFISPGLLTKPLHFAYNPLIFGLNIRFNPSSTSTIAYLEFLGRAGIYKPAAAAATRTDGSIPAVIGTNTLTFTGSSLNANQGDYLRIESSTQGLAGVYFVTATTVSPFTSITIRKLDRSTFTTVLETGVTYSVWTPGVTGTAGPEVASCYLADGLGKDNAQDISNILYEFFLGKTVLSEMAEDNKVCLGVIGPSGTAQGSGQASGMNAIFDFFPKFAVSPYLGSYNPALGAHWGFPVGAQGQTTLPSLSGVDGLVDKKLDGTFNRDNWKTQVGSGNFCFVNPDNGIQGAFASVDLGKGIEVGSVVVRGSTTSALSNLFNADSLQQVGLIGNLYNAPDGSAPVASSVIRTSGVSNLTTTRPASLPGTPAIQVTSGDFLGSVVAGPNVTGSVTASGNSLNDPGQTFTASHVGMVLRINSGGTDSGSYRIVSLLDPNTVQIRNLDQTSKTWTSSATVNYSVLDAVQEGDMIAVPSQGAPTARYLVERLLSTTSAHVRISAFAAGTSPGPGVSWQCVKATWNAVKRLSYSVSAQPPEVANNNSFLSTSGSEQFGAATNSFKAVFDLSDLTTAQRTGRWWRFTAQPRWNTNADGSFSIDSVEFYDTLGNRIGASRNNRVDSVVSQPNFWACHITRLDFLQSNYVADTGTTGPGGVVLNGLCSVSGILGDIVTLPSTNKFLGYQARVTKTDGTPTASGNTFVGSGLVASDVGRTLYIRTGTATGLYRISALNVGLQTATVTSPAGNPISFSATPESGLSYSLHEGINAGTTNPDYIAIWDPGDEIAGRPPLVPHESTILSINDAMTILTLNNGIATLLSSKRWEIRRRAIPSTSTVVDSLLAARLLYSTDTYPLQVGDASQDSRGHLKFMADDIGSGNQRSDGAPQSGGATFMGSGFCSDDVGRVLLINDLTSASKGAYEIATFVSSSEVTVKNLYTGAAIVFGSTESAKTYMVLGERRFRIARYATVLKS